jgi:hypothetical protein
MMRILVIVGVFAAVTACNNVSTPTLPLPVAGPPQTVYTGTITDSVAGTGSLTVTVSSAESSTGGTWLETFPGKNARSRFVNGIVNGSSYTATVSDCVETNFQACFPNCRQTFTGTLTASTLSGSYAEVPGDSCATVRSGTVSTAKQ